MKRMFLWMVVVVAVLSLLVVGLVGCAGEEEGERTTITLDFATFWPAVDFQVSLGHKEWAKAISDRVQAETTNYTVKWNWYYSLTPGALRSGIQGGTYDVITAGPGYYSGVYPLWQGPEYPADTAVIPRKNAYTMSMGLQALWGNFTPLQTEFAAAEPQVQLMHYWSTGPGYFLMVATKNVTESEDFYTPIKKKIRAANPASVSCINALNATPVSLAMSAALEAFQAGTIDGILCPTDTPKGFGLSAYVRSCTYAPFSYQFVFYKLMNKATYTGLPATVKTIVDSVNAKYCDYYGKLRTWGEYDGLVFCRALGWNTTWFEYNLPVADPAEYTEWLGLVYPSCRDSWMGVNTTRSELWGNFTTIAQWADSTFGGWAYTYPAPPTPPTFP